MATRSVGQSNIQAQTLQQMAIITAAIGRKLNKLGGLEKQAKW